MDASILNFDDEVQKMFSGPVVKKDDLTIMGRRIAPSGEKSAEALLAAFLDNWDFENMKYSIWEYSHKMEFTVCGIPDSKDLDLLERGHIFDKDAGTLQIRRDKRDFFWSFIGPKGTVLPEGVNGSDFWESNPNVELRWRRGQKAMLWGEYDHDLGRWRDDRVGWAELKYPFTIDTDKKGNDTRLQIEYDLLMNGGQVAFVWWKGCE